jgi:hypothetical protein
MHAGGVLIAPGKLTDFCPLYSADGGADSVVSQFDKDDVELAGLVKFDFLGLRTLTILDEAVRSPGELASRGRGHRPRHPAAGRSRHLRRGVQDRQHHGGVPVRIAAA